MLSLRTHALITAGLFAAIMLAPWALHAAQSSFASPAIFESTVKAVVFGLFLACGYSAIPLMLKLFLAAQRGIGNAGVAPIGWLERHQRAVVIGAWLLISLGVAVPFRLRSPAASLGKAASARRPTRAARAC